LVGLLLVGVVVVVVVVVVMVVVANTIPLDSNDTSGTVVTDREGGGAGVCRPIRLRAFALNEQSALSRVQ
jgi:hypothetical protein